MNQSITLNADFLRDLSVVAEDESLMKKAVRYIKHLAEERQSKDATLMTKEEFYAKLDRAEQDIKDGKGTTFTNVESMHAWLNAL